MYLLFYIYEVLLRDYPPFVTLSRMKGEYVSTPVFTGGDSQVLSELSSSRLRECTCFYLFEVCIPSRREGPRSLFLSRLKDECVNLCVHSCDSQVSVGAFLFTSS